MTLKIQDQYVAIYKTQQQCLGKGGKKCKQNEMHTYYKRQKNALILDHIMAINY
jgi:hypothetical protein